MGASGVRSDRGEVAGVDEGGKRGDDGADLFTAVLWPPAVAACAWAAPPLARRLRWNLEYARGYCAAGSRDVQVQGSKVE